MKKIILASHHTFAAGLKDTVNYICPDMADIKAISAYISNKPVEDEIKETIESFATNDQILVFTDLLGGSVNQAFVKYLADNNVELITGMNLPVVMSLIMTPNDEVTESEINNAIESAREQLIYVNDYIKVQVQELDEEDE